jgi:aminoglycoside phosphotransferase (APT) family kinase protein
LALFETRIAKFGLGLFHMNGEVSALSQIVSTVVPGSSLVRQWSLGGGISCTMTALEIECSDGIREKLIVREVGKWSFENYPNSVKNEYELLRCLRDCGISVANPRYYDLSCYVMARPYLVLDYVEGSPDLTVEDRTKRVVVMAETLAKIHSVDINHPALGFMEPSPLNIRPAGETMNEELQESKIRSVLASVFPSVVENRYTFRHGDFWPGNMVWKDSELAAVIDWEETSIGDPLFDVAIARLDILWAYGTEAMDTFTEQYQSKTDLDFTYLPYWDLRVSLRPISGITEWAKSFPQLGRPDVTVESMTLEHRWFVDQAIECLECHKNI